jgi:GMP synthase-like glutamine amidotransferase
LFIGQLTRDWDKRWKVYLAFKMELPSEEELKSIKILVFPGSARAVYDEENLFVPVVSEFIRKVMSEYSNIKLFGSCFGHQMFAHALGGHVEKMKDISPER